MQSRHSRPGATPLLAAALLLIAAATLTPQAASGLRQDFFAPVLLARPGAWQDVLQNVLLYVPLGLALGVMHARWRTASLLAASVSLATELCQFAVPGRDPVAADVAINAAGASLGWVAAFTPAGRLAGRGAAGAQRAAIRALGPSPQAAASLSLAWAALAACAIVLTCWLLSPAIPPPHYFVVSSPFMDAVPGPLRIGSDGSREGYFNGTIDEVRIFSRARSAGEIAGDMERAVADDERHPDLVASYGFDSSGAGAMVRDDSGRGHHGTPHGAAWTSSGRFGGALAFDGRAAEVIVNASHALDLRQSMTLEAWVLPRGAAGAEAAVVAHAGDAYHLRAVSRRGSIVPAAGARFGEVPRRARPRRRLPANRWTHLAATYDGQSIRLFVDGALAAQLRHWSGHHPAAASLDGARLSPGFVARPEEFSSRLSADFTLRLAVTCGPLDETPAAAFMVHGVGSAEALVVDAAGSELQLRSASWARRLRLAPAAYRVPDALAGCVPGEVRTFTVKGPAHAPLVGDGDGRVMAGSGPGIASAWTVLLDSRTMSTGAVAAVSACYLALLLMPFGFWMRARPASALGGLVLLGCLLLGPRVWDTRPPDGADAAAAAAGIGAGRLAWRRRERRLRSRFAPARS